MLKISLVILLVLGTWQFTMAPNAVYTIFASYYPDTNLGGHLIYIRGDGCNLTWSKGVPLNRTAANEWKTALLCADNMSISVKLLLNDTVWMFGSNRVFTGGERTIEIYPSFHPVANKVIDKTNVTSKIVGNTRKCSIYYPPSYFDNNLKKY